MFSRSISLAALSAALAGCATSASSQKPADPQVPQSTEPHQVVALGATYMFPAFIGVEAMDNQPGATNFDFSDTVTRCEGHAIFETVGDAKDHETYIKQKLLPAIEDAWKKDGATYTPSELSVPLLGTTARVTQYTVKKGDDTSGSAVVDHHFADQALSVVLAFDCPEPGVVQKEIDTLPRVVDTQKRL